MPKKESYTSDLSDEEIEPQDVVTITVTRQGESTVSVISEEELGLLMEESEALGSLILRDD